MLDIFIKRVLFDFNIGFFWYFCILYVICKYIFLYDYIFSIVEGVKKKIVDILGK